MDLLAPALPQQGSSSKNEEKQKKKKSFRFELSLKTTEDCPEFSYAELLKDVNKKKKTKTKERNGDAALDDDAKQKADAESVARYFEEKYGGGSKVSRKRRRDRMEELADVGYGYDETDPFVDNSECYDEVVPSSLTTQFGGFYINSGKLEFKQVSDESNPEQDDEDEDALPLSAHLKKKRKADIFFDSDESDFVDSNGISKKKKIKKRKGSVEREEKRRRKLSLQGKEKLSKLTKGSKKKPRDRQAQLLVAKAKAQHHMNADKLSASKHGHSSNHSLTNGNTPSTSISDTGRDLLDILDNQDGNINSDGIITILDSDPMSSSDDFNQSRTSKSSGDDTKLPHSIPNIIKEKISSLTKIAKSNEKEGKVKFFSPDVNNILLGIEVGSQALTNRERSGIYQHLTPHVPCSKDTLIKRMKKLHASKQDERLRKPLLVLKQAIDEVMDEQTQRYDEECAAQQLAKSDDRLALAASTDEDDDGTGAPPGGEEKTKRVYAPRRKFKWTDRIRQLFFDVVRIKVEQFELLKNRSSQSAEEYLKNFFELEVKVLWPKGWMQARMLYKESREIHNHITGNQAKQKKVILSGNKKAVTAKVDKKPTHVVNINSAMIKPTVGTELSRASKQLFKDNSMSMSMNLDSDAVPEKMSPLKQQELMNKTITSAQKEVGQKKVVHSRDYAVKHPGLIVKDLGQVKSIDSAQPKHNIPLVKDSSQNKSQTLYKMLDSMASISKSSKIADITKDAHKTLKVWNESGHSSADGVYVGSTKHNSSHKSTYNDSVKTSSPSLSKNPGNMSSSKTHAKKTVSKASTNVNPSMNSQLENYNELIKLAMMPPPGGPHMPGLLPPLAFPPGVLQPPASASMEEFSNLMKLQQATLQRQMQASPTSLQAYLTGLAAGPIPNASQYPYSTKPQKVKPKSTFVPVSSGSKSGHVKEYPQDGSKKHHKSHHSQSESRKPLSHSVHYANSTAQSNSDHRKKGLFSSPGLPANHASSKNASPSYTDNIPRNSSGHKRSSFSPVGLSNASSNNTSSPAKVSPPTTRTINKIPFSYTPPSITYPSNQFSIENLAGKSMSYPSQNNASFRKYDKLDGAKSYHPKQTPDANVIHLPTTSVTSNQMDKAAMEALISARNHLQAGNSGNRR